MFFFECSGDHRDLHVLTHSFPTRRSSALVVGRDATVLERPQRCVDAEPGRQVARDAIADAGQRLVGKWEVGEALWKHSLPRFLGGHRPGPTECLGEACPHARVQLAKRSEEHTSEFQSLMRISYAVFCLKK